MPPVTAAQKPELVPALPAPSTKSLAEKMVRLASDIDGQRHVVDRAREGAEAAKKLLVDAEAALGQMNADARAATAEWSKAIGGSK